MKNKAEKWIEECRCYGVNKEWGKWHCPIHRFTESPKNCKHNRISIDDMDEKGNHRCRDCGVYVLPKWKDNLNRRYAFKMHLTGRWLYYLVDDDDEETIYGFLDNWIIDIIKKYVQSERERIVKACCKKCKDMIVFENDI